MRNQQGVDHNPCYTHTKIGIVTGGGCSMANGHSAFMVWHMHAAVIHIIIIGMTTYGKNKHLRYSLYQLNGVWTIIYVILRLKEVWSLTALGYRGGNCVKCQDLAGNKIHEVHGF